MQKLKKHVVLLILLCVISITSANAQCGNPAFAEGVNRAYVDDDIYSRNGVDYKVKVAGWANNSLSDWAYAPGTGAIWTNAWTLSSNPCSAVSSHCVPYAVAPTYVPCVSTSILPYQWPSHRNWFLVAGAGVSSQTIDMTALTPTSVGKIINPINGYEGVSAVSDDGGNLLFFSNGRLNWDKCLTNTATTLKEGNEGGTTGTRGSASQGIIIVRHPLDPGRYHAFTTDDAEGGTAGFNHFLLDHTGTVISTQRLGTYRTGESVAATMHENGVDIWVTTHQSGTVNLQTYLVKCDGSVTGPVSSAVTIAHGGQSERGGVAFSYDGSKFVKAHAGGANEVTVHTFDKATGVIGAGVVIPIHASGQDAPYDVLFSPDGSRVYISTATGTVVSYIVQSMNAVTIAASRTVLGIVAANTHAAIEIGPDGNLYQSGGGPASALRRINGNLNTGGAFSVTAIAGTLTWKGLPTMYLPPAEEPDIVEVGPYCNDDAAVDIATNWMCRNINAEDVPNALIVYSTTNADGSANGITNAISGNFDPANAKIGSNRIIFTRCSVDDTIFVTVNQCVVCPDTTLNGSFPPICSSVSTLDLTTVENGKVGTWTVTTQPGGGDATITVGDQFNSNSAVAGNYTVTFTVTGADPTCVMPIRTFIINPQPTVSVGNVTICAGDPAATFTATSATATGWTWSANGSGAAQTTTGIAAGAYTVVVTDGTCSSIPASGALTVNVKPDITVADQVICAGDAAVTFDAGAGFTSYLWSGTGGSTSAIQTATGTTGGTYIVEVEDANGCRDTTTANLTVNVKPDITVADQII
ncbi:MAG: hypothetical protein ACJAZ2_000724, partial [Glaciecola sp.]